MGKILSYVLERKLVSLAGYYVLFFLCAIGFVQIADEVTEREVLWLDEAVLRTINTYENNFWDVFFVVITQLGGVAAIIVLSAGIITLLTLRRKFKAAIIIGTSVAGAALLNVGLKFLFERTRPDLWEQLVLETSFSFPSGHSMISAALGLAVILICWGTRYRWFVVTFVSLYIFLIGFSRLYLGVHYPTDVLAGWLVSGAWVAIVAITLQSSRIQLMGKKLISRKAAR